MQRMDTHIKLELTKRDWEILSDGFADIACWFMGFKAAHIGSANIELPPQLEKISNLMSNLKKRINDT